jgi:hypothetical protein
MQPTNIEAIQDTAWASAHRAVCDLAVARCLYVLDRDPHLILTYLQKLQRLEEVIARELQALRGSD